jgi:hypothetical protein
MCWLVIMTADLVKKQAQLRNMKTDFAVWLSRSRISRYIVSFDRLCGLGVRVRGYRSRGPGFDSRCYKMQNIVALRVLLELLGFWALSIVQYYKKKKTQRSGSPISVCPQV